MPANHLAFNKKLLAFLVAACAITSMAYLGDTRDLSPGEVVPIVAALGVGMMSMSLINIKGSAVHSKTLPGILGMVLAAGACYGGNQIGGDEWGLLIAMVFNFAFDALISDSYASIAATVFDNMALAYILGNCTGDECASTFTRVYLPGILYFATCAAVSRLLDGTLGGTNDGPLQSLAVGALIGVMSYIIVVELASEMQSSVAWVEGTTILVGFGIAPLLYILVTAWEDGQTISIRAIRKAVAAIYVGYAVAIVIGLLGHVPLRTVLIVCFGAHFIGLFGSLNMSSISTYPKQLAPLRTLVILVDGAQFIALAVVIFATLSQSQLAGLAMIALVGVVLCAYKLWVTRPATDGAKRIVSTRANSNAPTTSTASLMLRF